MCNVDAAIFSQLGFMGMGYVIPDSTGNLSQPVSHQPELCLGLVLALQKPYLFDKIYVGSNPWLFIYLVEVDALEIVNAISNSVSD